MLQGKEEKEDEEQEENVWVIWGSTKGKKRKKRGWLITWERERKSFVFDSSFLDRI